MSREESRETRVEVVESIGVNIYILSKNARTEERKEKRRKEKESMRGRAGVEKIYLTASEVFIDCCE